MSAGPVVAKADQVAWWVALDVICDLHLRDFERGLELARKCRHPEAQWLCSLFPPGVTKEEVVRVLEAQDDSPLVVFLRGLFDDESSCSKRQGWATRRRKLVCGVERTTPFG